MTQTIQAYPVFQPSIQEKCRITVRTMHFERHQETWPWRKVDDSIEEVSMVQIHAAFDPKWLKVMTEDFGGIEKREYNDQRDAYGHYLESRLTTISPDRLLMTVRHYQYRDKSRL